MVSEEVKKEVQLQMSAGSSGIWYSIQRQVKRAAIQQMMHECQNKQCEAALRLGVSRDTLRGYIRQVFTESEMTNMGIEP